MHLQQFPVIAYNIFDFLCVFCMHMMNVFFPIFCRKYFLKDMKSSYSPHHVMCSLKILKSTSKKIHQLIILFVAVRRPFGQSSKKFQVAFSNEHSHRTANFNFLYYLFFTYEDNSLSVLSFQWAHIDTQKPLKTWFMDSENFGTCKSSKFRPWKLDLKTLFPCKGNGNSNIKSLKCASLMKYITLKQLVILMPTRAPKDM